MPVDAPTPGRLTRADWAAVLRRAGRRVLSEELPVRSAGTAFFAVLSVAPVLVTALSVYGAVNTPEQALEQLSGLAGLLPPALEQVVADQLTTITTASTQVLTRRGLLGLVIALWTATTAMSCLIDALNVVYHERESRSLPRRTGLALALVLGGALLLGAVIAGLGITTRAAEQAPDAVRLVVAVLITVVLAVVMIGALSLLYRLAPDRRSARWTWTTPGALAATALWLLTSLALFAWVQRLGTYEATYGSLAGVAVSMLWLFLTVLLVLVGAALDAEAERQTEHDSTVGPPRPLGQRGAVVADDAPPHLDDGRTAARRPGERSPG